MKKITLIPIQISSATKNMASRLIVGYRFTTSLMSTLLLIVTLFSPLVAHAQEDEQDAGQPTEAKIFDMDISGDEQASSEEAVAEDLLEDSPAVEERHEQDNRTTAEKLEDLKSEVLAVNRDLFILEEDLLFPASTQLAAYFSVDIGYFFSLDNIKLKIDDKQVTHFLYTKKDVDALYRGAIQKVYLGNVSTGAHEVVAIVIGHGPHNREYRLATSFTFDKDTEAKAIEIQLRDDAGKLQPKLKVVEW